VLSVMKSDHQQVEELFRAFEKAGTSAHKTKQRLVDQMVEVLSLQTAAEEEVVYPVARRDVPRGKDAVLEALEEHQVVKWELLELSRTKPSDERFDAKVKVMMANVRRHVREEERHMFPALRTAIDRERLVEMADQLRSAREHLPTHPHPRMPDEPPMSVVAGTVTSVIDRVRDSVRKSTDDGQES
jgi:hemerythrin superfamily protein